jgi:hypothetical protein
MTKTSQYPSVFFHENVLFLTPIDLIKTIKYVTEAGEGSGCLGARGQVEGFREVN